MNTDETSADIIREMRDAWGAATPTAEDLAIYADRLEAAAKREREAHAPKPDPNWKDICAKCADSGCSDPPDCEYFGDPDGCNSPIYGEHPAAEKPAGNNAAMRKALIVVYDWILKAGYVHGYPDTEQKRRQLYDMMTKALSKPARNCDMGTAEEQEERFKHYCGQHYSACDVDAECFRCPLSSEKTSCEFAWAQLPYEERGDHA